MVKKDKNRNKKERKKWSFKRKLLTFILSLFLLGIFSFLFLFYGPIESFRNFWITSAMTTMNHQYLATWLYSDKYIDKVLKSNFITEVDESTDTDAIKFKKYTTSIYKNEYEKEILTKDSDNDLYKVIEINEKKYKGFLVAIYDPSRIHLATTEYLGTRGEDILTVAKKNEAIIAMNGGGFYDPDWNSNGAIPHGTVIKDGKLVGDYSDAFASGGIIGFNKENKLVLGKMSAQEALNAGIRDAVEFGPYLMINGKRSFVAGNGGWGIAPRSAIGQRQDGITLFLVINGRLANSIGADMIDLCDCLEKYGAYNAANLDGGSSSELVIQDKIINTPVAGGKNGLRNMPTFWIVK